MLEYLQYRNPNSQNKASHLVIMLHGYGANGANLISLAHDFHQSLPDAHFISPNAIEPWEGGFPDCYQWFSLYDKMERRKFEDLAFAIKKANDILKNFIEAKKILSEVEVPHQAYEIKGLDHAIDIHCVRHAQNFIKNLNKNSK